MEVEVVLGEVGEYGHREVDRVGSVELKGMGGDLHRTREISSIKHGPERPLQVYRLRRGPLHRVLDTSDDALDRPQEPGRPAGRLQQVAHEEGGGGFAVRS